jgi:hypothetical protein
MHTPNSSACTQSEMLNDFVIMLSEESNIHAHPQTHVATPTLHPHGTSCLAKVHHTTPRGFEPLRAEPNGFRVHLLNRSDTVSCREGKKHKAMHRKTLLDARQQRSDVCLCAQRSEDTFFALLRRRHAHGHIDKRTDKQFTSLARTSGD